MPKLQELWELGHKYDEQMLRLTLRRSAVRRSIRMRIDLERKTCCSVEMRLNT